MKKVILTLFVLLSIGIFSKLLTISVFSAIFSFI